MFAWIRAFIARYRCAECWCWWGDHEIYCDRHPLMLTLLESITVPKSTFDFDAHERLLWMDVPSAVWLDPTRFARPAWPALPTRDDVKFDNTPIDMAVAYVALSPEERAQLATERPEPKKQIARISSQHRFDRNQAPARTVSDMRSGAAPTWKELARDNNLCECGERYVKDIHRMMYICPNCKHEEYAL